MKMKAKVTQSGPTLCDPMDYTVHGILQARILEWVVRGASSASGKGHEEGGLAYARRDQASGVSLKILEHLSHLLKTFSHFIVINTVKGFGIVSKAEIDVFLELLLFP